MPAMSRTVQHFLGPPVQALARQFRGQYGLTMHLRVDTEHHAAGIWLPWFPADPGAGSDVVLDGLAERFLKLFHTVGMEAHAIANAGDPACQNAIRIIVFDTGGVAFAGHGVTLILSKNARARHDALCPSDTALAHLFTIVTSAGVSVGRVSLKRFECEDALMFVDSSIAKAHRAASGAKGGVSPGRGKSSSRYT